MNRTTAKIFSTIATITLSACFGSGNGGGGSNAQPQPQPQPQPPLSTPPTTNATPITIRGHISGVPGAMVVLKCVAPSSNPLFQGGCDIPATNMGSILETFRTTDANGDYTFDAVVVQYHSPLGGIPIPAGYIWKVVPYSCSIYWYGGVYTYPLPPTPYSCSPAERTFPVESSINGMDFLMW